MITSILYAGLLLVALLFAFLGSRGERQLAWVILGGNLATIAVLALGRGQDFSAVSIAYLGVDILAAAALCTLAIMRPSWMSILVAAFQLNGTLAHVVKLVAPETISLSYAILLRIWGWPMVLTLLIAHFLPAMREILRQSHLQRIPRPFGPPPLGRSGPATPAEPAHEATPARMERHAR